MYESKDNFWESEFGNYDYKEALDFFEDKAKRSQVELPKLDPKEIVENNKEWREFQSSGWHELGYFKDKGGEDQREGITSKMIRKYSRGFMGVEVKFLNGSDEPVSAKYILLNILD